MPISDLLASITGEKPKPSSSTTELGTTTPKRKAEGEPRGVAPAAKILRTNSDLDRPHSNPSARPSSAPQPSARPLNRAPQRPSLSKDGSRPSASGSRPLPSRPLNRPVNPDSGPQAEPKKRSFAEIMARAKANTSARESFGKIQHKSVEKTLTMRERKELKAEEARKTKKTGRKQISGKSGGTAAPPRNGANGANGAASAAQRSLPSAGVPRARDVPAEEKKVKKAALATTGYTGTARPRPGATPAKPGVVSRPSQEAKPSDRSRYGGALSRPRRRDDFDEELDDFIEYDDEEEEPGYGLGRRAEYDSAEDESDMEAGLSDIDEEEARAERQGRREDLEQEALERKLKKEKEERKRKLMARSGS
ncbi:hypothetical protein B0T25DRAFT_26811 [Lasiosphaeria hispida]|uniref:SPT2 chromatin protein n=1 Tax=Lasiosphaeria hispida TaxID=260671 RepID=A0AAJ0HU74_9PEZI|nr:hypothetical protein B0T25DRAFT_26811 [Lasiosphaeria hispida]